MEATEPIQTDGEALNLEFCMVATCRSKDLSGVRPDVSFNWRVNCELHVNLSAMCNVVYATVICVFT